VAFRRSTLNALRIVAGVFLVALFLHAATLATRDCTVGLYVFDNCLWVWLYEHLGLPANRFLRACALELVGLSLLAGIYLTIRYVFPPWKAVSSTPAEEPPSPSKNSSSH
jgi:hypothetical protein